MRNFLGSIALGVIIAATLARPARADQDETGPNFVVPTATAVAKPDVPERLKAAVQAYQAARDAQKGASEKIADAQKKLLALRKDVPELAPPCYYLGILYQWTKEYEKARQVLESAISLNPKFHQAYIELGDVYCWLKQPEKGLVEYTKALEIAPRYAHGYFMRGYAKLRLGDLQGANADAAAGAKLEPLNPYGLMITAVAERELKGPPWKQTFTRESDHYIVKTPVSQTQADEIGRLAELIYSTYTSIFPKIEKVKRKFEILCYASREEYHANGGPESAGGHYDGVLRKLYIFKYEKEDDTRLVLFHEGFHQFLHDYLDDAPQWFNEGLGDFFGPTRPIDRLDKKGKILKTDMRLSSNPWRLDYVKAAIRAGKVRGWRQLMLMSQRELYDPEWMGIHYAQSWSIIFFLIRGGAPPDKNAGPYFPLLKAYFNALRKGDGQEEAFDKAFGKQNVPALEKEWRDFVLKLGPGD